MISQLKNKGYTINDPWDAVTLFEDKVAAYAGSKYAVAVDSATNGIFLCLKYLGITNQVIEIPKNTYASVPMQCIHAGNKIKFIDLEWSGVYQLYPTPIYDGAVRFSTGMYIKNSYQVLSFHHRKTIKIGRGGMILTDNADFVKWVRPMIYDGRHKYRMYQEDDFACIGYHMYMTPEEAAKGVLLFDEIRPYNPDTGNFKTYKDLSQQKIFFPYMI